MATRIAAGEVIDRPYSIARELLDNALDAGATQIEVTLVAGGIERVEVYDNGAGISSDDLQRCALRHATSKVRNEADLERVGTLGFRGEALASIAACARLEIVSRPAAAAAAARLVATAASRQVERAAGAPGTRVTVSALFAELPARRKFLRRPSAEAAMCRRVVYEKALAHPHVTFRLQSGGGAPTVLAASDALHRFADVLGPPFAPQHLFVAEHESSDLQVALVGARPELARADRSRLFVLVNRRRLSDYALQQAVEYGYAAVVPGGRFPVACVHITLAAHLVDFNVHPAKREARFRNLPAVHQAVARLVQQAVAAHGTRLPEGIGAAPLPAGDAGRDIANAAPAAGLWRQRAAQWSDASGAPGSTRGPGTHGARGPAGPNATDSARHAGTGPVAGTAGDGLGTAAPGHDTDLHGTPPPPDPNAPLRLLGQAFGTFLLVEAGPHVFFVDQHAAHERVLFEDLCQRRHPLQPLLVPIELHLEADQLAALGAIRSELQRSGIVLALPEAGDDGLARVTAVAEPLQRLPARWLADYLGQLRGTAADLQRAVLADVACALAVKAGEALADDDALTIVRRSFAIDLQHCPHGRPLWSVVTRDQLRHGVGRF